MQGGRIPLTREGQERLGAELEYLRTVKRQEIAEWMADAREDDNARDNVPTYDYAKNDQAMVEGRIQELEYILRNAELIDEERAHRSDTAQLGSTVSLQDKNGNSHTFTIVGRAEVSPSQGRISNESPVGSALLGKRVGDSVEVQVPAGMQHFTITAIS